MGFLFESKNDILKLLLPVEKGRSEEHTSELQSPYDLVCCLLLEKKNDVTFSAPITNTMSCVCEVMNCCAISILKRKPAHAAETSRQSAFLAPSVLCTQHAVAGNR